MKDYIDQSIHEKADVDCTLMELWERYQEEIAVFRNFANAKETIKSYTTTLSVIKEALEEKTAAAMMPIDCWNAVVSVRYRSTANGTVPYSNSTLKTRLTILKDIYSYLEHKAILLNPLWKAPWEYLEDKEDFSMSGDEMYAAVEKSIGEKAEKFGSLGAREEKRLMRRIRKHIKEDGRWVGLLLYLMLGLRPSEGRGLRYEDLQQFQSHPERRYLIISGTADKHGKKRKEMKNRYSHRCIPEVYELAELLKIREDFVREEVGDDISKLPIICFENQYTTPCTAVQMANFSKKQLSSIMTGDEFADLSMQMMVNSTQPKASGSAADMDAASADNSLTTYLLRHNFATMMRAHTTLDSDSIHLLMGHATKKKRCEARNAYSEDSLYKMMLKMDQRVIDREIHGGFYTNLDSFEKHQVLSFAEHQIILPAMENETELLCSVETEGSGDTISIKGRPNLVRNIQIKAENHIEYNGEYGRIFTKPL